MGRINEIYKPEDWRILKEGESLINNNDIIYQMKIGEGEDYQSYDITEFISKETYENIINGNYTIKVFPYAKLPILLFDENKKIIPLVKGMEIPMEFLNTEQEEIIAKTKTYIRK